MDQFPEEASVSLDARVDPVEKPNAGRWTLSGRVRTKNAFGAKVAYKWMCEIERKSDGDKGRWENVETVLQDEGGRVVARTGTGSH